VLLDICESDENLCMDSCSFLLVQTKSHLHSYPTNNQHLECNEHSGKVCVLHHGTVFSVLLNYCACVCTHVHVNIVVNVLNQNATSVKVNVNNGHTN